MLTSRCGDLGHNSRSTGDPGTDPAKRDRGAAASACLRHESVRARTGASRYRQGPSGLERGPGSAGAPAIGLPSSATAGRVAMSPVDVFRRLIAAFDQAGIAYMLSGSFAGAYYGAARSTQDIDFVIEATAAKLEARRQGLPQNEYYVDFIALYGRHTSSNLCSTSSISRLGGKSTSSFVKRAISA